MLSFYRAEHLSGLELFVWLEPSDAWATAYGGACWDERRVIAYEDRNGQMIPHDVLIADLEVLEEH